ncbi:hypothetical protein ACFVYJ_03155, partial [Pontibacter sp. JAM-7]
HGVRGMEDILRNPIYATGLGLLQYAKQDRSGQPPVVDVADLPVKENIILKLKTWIQNSF